MLFKKCISVLLSLSIVMLTLCAVGVYNVKAIDNYSGTVYYVDADNGNDNNNGTSENTAFKSLDKVNGLTLSAGDAVLLKKGCVWTDTMLYPKGSGTEDKPITISTYGEGEKPIIISGYDSNAGYDAAVLLKNQSYVVIDGLQASNGNSSTESQYIVKVAMDNGYTTYGVEIKNCTIMGSDVNDWDSTNHSKLTGIEVFSNSYYGYIGSLLVEDNEIYNCKSIGIHVDGAYGGCSANGTPNSSRSARNVVVRGNYLENIGKDGILVTNSYKPLIEYNTCATSHSYAQKSYHVAMWVFSSYNAVFQYNESYDTKTTYDGQGFDCDYQCYYTVFQYNYSHDNEGGFMLICCEPTSWDGKEAFNVGATVRYNISQNDKHALFTLTGGIDDTKIYNNTIYSKWAVGDGSDYVFYEFSRGNSLFNGRKYAYNTLIANNIFYLDSYSKFGLANSTKTSFKNNLIYGRYASKAPDESDDNMTVENNIIGKNPCFVNAGGAGIGLDSCKAYELYDNSPAINSGAVVQDNGGLDFFGNKVSSTGAPNIGAYNGSGVKYNKDDYIIDEEYMSVIDFEKHNETASNTNLERVVNKLYADVTIDKSVVNALTNSTKALKLEATSSTSAAKTTLSIYADEFDNSSGIRFWASGNGKEQNATLQIATSAKTSSVEFKVPANGGYVKFNFNEVFVGGGITDEEMTEVKSIALSCLMEKGEAIYFDDIQKFMGEAEENPFIPTIPSQTTAPSSQIPEKVVYGDCDDDSKINMADVLILRKYLAKWNVKINLLNADCNADTKINMADVLLLRKYLAKWDVTLGK